MKRLFASVMTLGILILTLTQSCNSGSPTPSTDLTDPRGTYRTNGVLDPLCIAITDPSQLPVLTVDREANGNYLLTRTDFLPKKRTIELAGVTVQTKTDTLVLFKGSQQIGSLRMGSWRDFSGKKPRDMVAPLILITYQDTTGQNPFFYYGFRQ